MSVIIRLQNLPWSANALDIRQFFHGLSIPEGGVHIVGGEQGDAFIAFSTDEDARQAFARNNGKIKEVQISLMLSSRTEMQKVIEAARAQSYAAFMQNAAPTQAQTQTTVPLPAAVPPLMPAAVPDFNKKENSKERDSKNDKRDRRRSRSKSRERKDRDRRDRRYRDRSRSRSRERRERRRRDRSRSRGRSRSRDRDRRTSRDRKRSPDKKVAEIWTTQNSNDSSSLSMVQQPPSLLANFGASLDDARRNLNALNVPLNRNNFPAGFGGNRAWSMVGAENGQNFLLNRPDNSSLNSRQLGGGMNQNQSYQQNRGYPSRNIQTNDEQYSPNSERSDRDALPNTCAKLQPFFGGYGEIRRFFQGIFISNVGIKFINNEYGHRTGMVYIQFGHPQGKAEAFQKNGELLNGLNVEISHLDDQEFEDAIDRYQPEQNSDDAKKFRNNKAAGNLFNNSNEPKVFSCLIVDDLPTYVKEQDILKMFSPRPLISLILTSKPRGGRIAYVKFGSADEAKKALEESSNHIVEGKPVTVLSCHDSEFDAVNEQHDVDLDRKPANLDTNCLNITRLPLQTNNVEITDFFSDIGVRPMKIHLMSNRLGFTGQAFCEFKTFEEAARALKKDNASFGPNIVSVQPISRDEMEHILQQSQMTNPQQQQQQQNQPRPLSLMAQPTRPPFYPRSTFDNRGMMGGMNSMPRFMGHRPLRPRYNINMNNHDQDPPGCTVYMDNVPYKAGTNEILEFFDGYDITNNVSRRYNPNNTPSAEAKVVFTSPEEAYRAVQERHGQKIWDRPIYLKQV